MHDARSPAPGYRTHRWGRFRLSGYMLDQARRLGTDFHALTALLSQVLILHTRWIGDDIEYQGISPLFDELAEGDLIPEYLIEYQCLADGATIAKAFRRCR